MSNEQFDPELDKLFDKKLKEMLDLQEKRKFAGQPSVDEIDRYIGNVLPFVKEKISENMGDRDSILEKLSRIKLFLQKQNTLLSRQALCTLLVANAEDWCDGVSRDTLNQGDVESFRFLYDVKTGIRLSVNRIHEAEDALRNQQERQLQDITDVQRRKTEILGIQDSLTYEMGLYIAFKEEESESLGLMREDPTGFLLMGNFIDRIKEGSYPGLTQIHAKDYVLAGAELARDLYKKFYNIAGKLYPPNVK